MTLLLLIISACATVSPPQERVEHSELAKEEVLLAHPTRLRVGAVAWQGEVLHAAMQQERRCQPVTRRTVRHQRVVERHSRLVALDITLGALLTLGGGALLLSTPFVPGPVAPEMTDQTMLTPARLTLLGGLGLTGLGAPFLIHGIIKGVEGREREQGTPWTTTEDQPTGPAEACAARPAPPGRLLLRLGDEQVHEVPVFIGQATVDLAALRTRLCRDERHLGAPLRVSYEVPGAPPLAVAERDIDECIRRERAAQLLEEAAALLANAKEVDVVAGVAPLLERAAALHAGLPAQDSAGLQSESRSRSAIAERLSSLRAAFGQAALALLRAAAAQALSQGPEGYGEVLVLLDKDQATRGCLVGERCGWGVERAELAELLRPLAAQLAEQVQRQRQQLASVTSALSRRPAETQEELTQQGVAAAQERARRWCRPWLMEPAREACAGLVTMVKAAEGAIARSAEQRAQRQRALTTEKWRRHIAQCQRVNDAVRQLGAVRVCDSACRAAVARIRGDRDALDEVQIDGELDDTTKEHLQAACERAGCPSCP